MCKWLTICHPCAFAIDSWQCPSEYHANGSLISNLLSLLSSKSSNFVSILQVSSIAQLLNHCLVNMVKHIFHLPWCVLALFSLMKSLGSKGAVAFNHLAWRSWDGQQWDQATNSPLQWQRRVHWKRWSKLIILVSVPDNQPSNQQTSQPRTVVAFFTICAFCKQPLPSCAQLPLLQPDFEPAARWEASKW